MLKARTTFLVVFGILVGAPLGTSVATFVYADGFAYLSSKPTACINCHVMQDQYNSWQASSHHHVAVCNDCHANGNIAQKYLQKGVNGFLHSFAFTTGYFHQPIRIKGFNQEITHRSCVGCHQSMVESSHFGNSDLKDKNCLGCHREVGHRK